MKTLSSIQVHGAKPRRIELLQGDLTELGADEGFDLLVVSAFPDDYLPTRTSLIGALHRKGLSVADLAQDKSVDLRDNFSCWLSKPLTPSDRAVLHARIARRFDAMLLAGFVDEVIALRKHYQLDPNLPSMRCVGYRQALEHLDGYCDLPTFRDKGIFATRQLAKRQITWQRNFRESWGDLVEVDCLAAGMEKQVQHIVESRLD